MNMLCEHNCLATQTGPTGYIYMKQLTSRPVQADMATLLTLSDFRKAGNTSRTLLTCGVSVVIQFRRPENVAFIKFLIFFEEGFS